MNIFEAIELISAPFVLEEVYQEAEEVILIQVFTPNQESLYAKLPVEHKPRMLKYLANRYMRLLTL